MANIETTPTSLDAKVDILLVLAKETREQFVHCRAQCDSSLHEMNGRVRGVETEVAEHRSAHQVWSEQKHMKPHIHVAAGTWFVVALTAVLVIDVLIRILHK